MIPRLVACVLAIAGSTIVRADAVAERISHFTLANGLELVVAVRPELQLIAVNLTVNAGAIDDPVGKSGIAHLLEHVTLSGSTTIGSLDPAREPGVLEVLDAAHASLAGERAKPKPDSNTIRELERAVVAAQRAADRVAETGEILGGRLEAHGAIGLNATTSADATQFFAWVPGGALELWMQLEAERLQHPVFRRFYTEREVVLRETEARTSSGRSGQELLLAELLGDPATARPLAGDLLEIRGIDRPTALAYFQSTYRPDRSAVAVVGAVDPQQVRALCEKTLGRWRATPAKIQEAASRFKTTPPTTVQLRSLGTPRQPAVYFAFPRWTDSVALDALSELIGHPELSPVRRELIARRGLARSVGSTTRFPALKFGPYFVLNVFGNQGVPDRLLEQRMAALLKALPSAADADIDGAIRSVEMQLAAELSDPPSLAAALALYQAIAKDWRVPFQRLGELRTLDAAAVRATARELVAFLSGSEVSRP